MVTVTSHTSKEVGRVKLWVTCPASSISSAACNSNSSVSSVGVPSGVQLTKINTKRNKKTYLKN